MVSHQPLCKSVWRGFGSSKPKYRHDGLYLSCPSDQIRPDPLMTKLRGSRSCLLSVAWCRSSMRSRKQAFAARALTRTCTAIRKCIQRRAVGRCHPTVMAQSSFMIKNDVLPRFCSLFSVIFTVVLVRVVRSPLGGKLSPPEEWKRLEDPNIFTRQVTLTGWEAQASLRPASRDASRVATQRGRGGCDEAPPNHPPAAGAEDSNRCQQEDGAEKLNICGEGSSCALPPSEIGRRTLTSRIVSLNVSGAQIGDCLGRIASWAPWLRELTLAGAENPSPPTPRCRGSRAYTAAVDNRTTINHREYRGGGGLV